ncbi:metal-sulfur cluster assembly factor [Eupransor demetentiae]|uniref:Metal-sulfur cluster biosynthetic enzyme (PaaD) n=1 Tax=Eupransor demetentiae TaxID=3109584 RepID=A0ABP0ER64_9LACO|nr:Metal-sulfur cluster biosynthetic enzyme (PaaD) [Lactobacillaceae bacterium LMG 33000]
MKDQAKEKEIMDALTSVVDPELQVDIVNLGFINWVDLDSEGEATINMTLTMLGCPIMDTIENMVKDALKIVPGVKTTSVELAWEPAWTIDRMTDFAKMSLGLV